MFFSIEEKIEAQRSCDLTKIKSLGSSGAKIAT